MWLFGSNEPTEDQRRIAELEQENKRLHKQVQDYHDALRQAEHELALCRIRCEKREEAWQQMCAASIPVLDLMREQLLQAIHALESTIELNDFRASDDA